MEDTDLDNTSANEANGSTTSAATSLIGKNLDEYQILRRLGRGGMADVYVALHKTLERQVALKVLRRQLANDAGYVERFRREARAAAKLNHPNIVHVYEVGRAADHYYIAQELIDGGNLKDEVERNGPLNPAAASEVLRAVCSALEAAHLAGITHRDIKPENILRSQRGEIKVADFGLARVGSGNDLTQVGLTMGTPRYMSPEQVQGKTADARSDLYSLGCTMYFLLTGRPPFEADDALAIAFQHLHDTPKPLSAARGRSDVPDWLQTVTSRLMAKAPTDRFASAGDVLATLESSGVNSGPMSTMGGTASATVLLQQAMRTDSKRRRAQRLKWVTAALVPLLALGAGWLIQSRRRAPSISRLLVPDLVPQKATIEEQYLAAASRDDILAWRSVSEYFPPQASAKNAAYAIKADIQQARLLARTNRTDEAIKLLQGIADNTNMDRVYQVIALAELIELDNGDPKQTEQLRTRLRQTHRTLMENRPETNRILQSVLKPEVLQRLESS